MVVIVQDVQDVPPIFTMAPPVTRLPAGLLPGDKVSIRTFTHTHTHTEYQQHICCITECSCSCSGCVMEIACALCLLRESTHSVRDFFFLSANCVTTQQSGSKMCVVVINLVRFTRQIRKIFTFDCVSECERAPRHSRYRCRTHARTHTHTLTRRTRHN